MKLLHLGYYNYVTTDTVIALLDYRMPAAKKLVKSAREEKPRSVIDLTRGKKSNTLIVLTGDRYILSSTHRQQLAKRLNALDEEDSNSSEPVTQKFQKVQTLHAQDTQPPKEEA